MNCAKPLDPSDKFCSYCGHKVIPPQAQVERMASDIAAKNLEKHAKHYSQMSSDDLVRLSAELGQLTPVAQKALILEIAKRGIKDTSEVLEQAKLEEPQTKQPLAEESPVVSTHSSPTTQIAPTTQDTASAQVAVPVDVSSQKRTPAPYAKFVVLLLLCCLCASIGVFALFDAFARNTTAFAVEALSVLPALLFGWLGWKNWKNILESEPRHEVKSRRRVRNALVTSVIFILLYLGLAAFLGSLIGQNRAEAIQLNSDISRQKELADHISKARNTVSNSISSYVAMYAGIESDVKDYSSTLLRLREELPKYDSKFPAQSDTTHKFMGTIERENRRSGLLTKQIEAAKQIALLDEYQQGAAWKSDMIPLLKEEDALDESK